MQINDINSEKKISELPKVKSKNFIKIIKGAIISIILTLILLTIYAALLSFTSISEGTMVPVVLIVSAVSILIGSSMSSINIEKQGMLNGGLVGLIYVLFIYILSSIFLTGFRLDLNSIIMIVISIVTGMIGRNNRYKYEVIHLIVLE